MAGQSLEPKVGTPAALKAQPTDESMGPVTGRRELLPKTPVAQIKAAFMQEQMTPGSTPSPFTCAPQCPPLRETASGHRNCQPDAEQQGLELSKQFLGTQGLIIVWRLNCGCIALPARLLLAGRMVACLCDG